MTKNAINLSTTIGEHFGFYWPQMTETALELSTIDAEKFYIYIYFLMQICIQMYLYVFHQRVRQFFIENKLFIRIVDKTAGSVQNLCRLSSKFCRLKPTAGVYFHLCVCMFVCLYVCLYAVLDKNILCLQAK